MHAGDPLSAVIVVDDAMCDGLLVRARASGRRRAHHNLHTRFDENPQRVLMAALRDSYYTPHRHTQPPKTETFVLLEGRIDVYLFDDDGTIRRRVSLGDRCAAIDLPPGVWHALDIVSDHALCLEAKPGPFDPKGDKEFAPWAPAEGSEACARYQTLLRAFGGLKGELS